MILEINPCIICSGVNDFSCPYNLEECDDRFDYIETFNSLPEELRNTLTEKTMNYEYNIK